MAAIAVIPARYASVRFPGKMIVAETGRPLVQHAVDQVRKCSRVREIIVAADDQRIADALKPFETRCVLTSPDHQSGTDRIAEVARSRGEDVVVNVQGDEPEIEPEIIDALIVRMETSGDDLATAATPFPRGADPRDPNLVKVVLSQEGYALYFSRAPIPYPRDDAERFGTGRQFLLHLGIYAYRRAFLLQFASWPQTPLEKTEKLEQLRALENGRRIFVHPVERATHGIDTPDQYAAFVARFRSANKKNP